VVWPAGVCRLGPGLGFGRLLFPNFFSCLFDLLGVCRLGLGGGAWFWAFAGQEFKLGFQASLFFFLF
jgi:hypothetical protein